MTNNELEFKNKEFDKVLEECNVNHIFTSPYNPTSNGMVERVNRTLTAILKASIDDPAKWDQLLPRAVMLYNNTYHQELKCSPSEFILRNSHEPSSELPLQQDTITTWREGHPNFKSYNVNQKVIKKMERIGHSTSYKLMQKFDGPFIVKEVQSNGLSYEIVKESDPNKIIKCHHQKLRAYQEVPQYFKEHIKEEDNSHNTVVESQDPHVALTHYDFSSSSETSQDPIESEDSETSVYFNVREPFTVESEVEAAGNVNEQNEGSKIRQGTSDAEQDNQEPQDPDPVSWTAGATVTK